MIDSLLISVHAFLIRTLILLSIDEILLPRYANWITNFSGLPLKKENKSSFKHMNSVLSAFIYTYLVVCSGLSSKDSAWRGVFWEVVDHLRSLSINVKPFSFKWTVGVHNRISLSTFMVLMYLLTWVLRQCQKSRCRHILIVTIYWLLISLLAIEHQSYCETLPVCFL